MCTKNIPTAQKQRFGICVSLCSHVNVSGVVLMRIIVENRKEIGALQAENYSLERQLFSYQKSIAYAHSRGGTTTEESTTYECSTHRPYLDRCVSTDTEYA